MKKLYRIFSDLNYGKQIIKAGTLSILDLPSDAEARLIAREHIAVAAGPPLAVLPGWRERARALRKLKILDVIQLAMAEAAQIAGALDVPIEEIETWQKEALEWLKPHNTE